MLIKNQNFVKKTSSESKKNNILRDKLKFWSGIEMLVNK